MNENEKPWLIWFLTGLALTGLVFATAGLVFIEIVIIGAIFHIATGTAIQATIGIILLGGTIALAYSFWKNEKE
ncbi:hypothetical protein [Kitasatospora sp. MBT66]|uniref:hypothetical protein n=1 Tax=Kitasatospora sp. MBT66 TaxID=1444769 RepID=UPI001314739B|nr:hypothetical protein [Kitasatospora sp. MBT66]